MCTQGMPLFMHTGTPRKHVSRSWRVPGAGVGEKVILLLDCTRTRRGNKQQKLPECGENNPFRLKCPHVPKERCQRSLWVSIAHTGKLLLFSFIAHVFPSEKIRGRHEKSTDKNKSKKNKRIIVVICAKCNYNEKYRISREGSSNETGKIETNFGGR